MGRSNSASELRDELKESIEGLAEAKTFDDKKNHGKSIYYAIQQLTPLVKQLADTKRERSN